ARGGVVGEPAADSVPELVRRHVAGVQHPVGPAPQLLQPAPLFADGFEDARLGHQRVAPPGFLEPPHQHFIGRLEEENRVLKPDSLQLAQRVKQVVEKLAAAHVADQRHPAQVAAGALAHFGELGDELRGQVVDAEIAQVFKGTHGGAFSRARQPGDDDESDGALRLRVVQLRVLLPVEHVHHVHAFTPRLPPKHLHHQLIRNFGIAHGTNARFEGIPLSTLAGTLDRDQAGGGRLVAGTLGRDQAGSPAAAASSAMMVTSSCRCSTDAGTSSVTGPATAAASARALLGPDARSSTRFALIIVATPMVMPASGTSSGRAKFLPSAAMRRVSSVRGTTCVRLAKDVPGSLSAIWPWTPMPRMTRSSPPAAANAASYSRHASASSPVPDGQWARPGGMLIWSRKFVLM